jgi:hypothetical protein
VSVSRVTRSLGVVWRGLTWRGVVIEVSVGPKYVAHNMNIWVEFFSKTWGRDRVQAVSRQIHVRGPCSIPDQSLWGLWWT